MNNTKARILSKLAALDSEKANKYLSRFASDLEATLQRTKSNDQIFESLDLLEQIIYQAPSKALRVIINIVNAKQPFKPTVRRYKGYRLEGKSHNTLIIKCLDLLGKIRYIKTEDVFELLVKLSGHQNNEVNTKAIGVLKELCQYNPFVMEKAGYYIQELIINEIKKWSSKKLAEHHGTILEITNRILQPSFSSHSMTDYKTFTLRQGTLVVNEKLINIRKDAVHLLKTIYAQSTELSHKKHILQVLNEATQTPIHGEYKDDMKQMIISNTNEIVDFYINILPDSENEIISVIEDQSHRFIQRFGADNLPKINQLQTMIESNPEYEMFRVFVGYDRGYLEGTDWKKAE
ncbi:MAG: hypothetical protein HY753_06615 [Nitrospirae bacterium]|nr:hypothetical protein [Nitrospirota bacterium]